MNDVVQYKVLFASPSDLKPERDRFPQIIDEINRVWGKILGFQITPIMFEHSCAPGASMHSSQNLISNDLGEDYDVFVGAYWQKYGTPTKDALSGTEEEFNNAYRRFCEDSSSVKILFYFKNSPPDSMDDIDLDAVSKIRAFRTSLEQKDVLYWTFSDMGSFEKCMREHLPLRLLGDKITPSSLLQKSAQLRISKNTADTNISPPQNEAVLVPEVEELGLLDYMEIYEESIASTSECLSNITCQTATHTKTLKQATSRLKIENSKTTPSKTNIRNICLFVADSTNQLSDNYEVEIPKYIENFNLAVESMIKIRTLYPSDEEGVSYPLNSLSEGINGAKSSIIGFKDSIAEGTSLIAEQKRANHRLIENLDKMIAACDASLQLMEHLA